MAGHNKWSKVKRLKAVTDGRRSKVFSSLSREITLAAKMGGGDPDGLIEHKLNALGRLFHQIPIAGRALHEMGVGEGADAGEESQNNGGESAKREAPHLRAGNLIEGTAEAASCWVTNAKARSAPEARTARKSPG